MWNELDVRVEFAFLIDIRILVHHVFAGNAHFVVLECCIIDTIQTHLDSHIVDCHARQGLHIFVPDWYQKGIDTLIFTLYDCLAKNKRVVGVFESVRDPVFLRKYRRTINYEFLGLFVVSDSCLHLDSIITIAKLCKAEASTDAEVVDLIEDGSVAFGV